MSTLYWDEVHVHLLTEYWGEYHCTWKPVAGDGIPNVPVTRCNYDGLRENIVHRNGRYIAKRRAIRTRSCLAALFLDHVPAKCSQVEGARRIENPLAQAGIAHRAGQQHRARHA